jgi:hypothetical protein
MPHVKTNKFLLAQAANFKTKNKTQSRSAGSQNLSPLNWANVKKPMPLLG